MSLAWAAPWGYVDVWLHPSHQHHGKAGEGDECESRSADQAPSHLQYSGKQLSFTMTEQHNRDGPGYYGCRRANPEGMSECVCARGEKHTVPLLVQMTMRCPPLSHCPSLSMAGRRGSSRDMRVGELATCLDGCNIWESGLCTLPGQQGSFQLPVVPSKPASGCESARAGGLTGCYFSGSDPECTKGPFL